MKVSKSEVRVAPKKIESLDADAIIVNLFEGVGAPGGATGAVDRALGGALSELIRSGEFKGKGGETVLLHTLGRLPAARVIVVGLGKQAEFDLDRVRQASAEGFLLARQAGCKSAASVVHGAGVGGLSPRLAARATVEGAILGLYRFEPYKDKPDDKAVGEVIIAENDKAKLEAVLEGAREGRILSDATNFARDLANRPGNKLTPSILAAEAGKLAKEHGIECEVLERQDMEKLGMGALLGVAKGSNEPPKLIVMRHRGGGEKGEWLGLVGKGLTFDAGGISLKPGEGMEEMKFDMAGGAAVIAAMGAIAQLGVKHNVLGVVPATENMPGGHAQRPGDVITAMNGKTVEVINTDAEGRLILADAVAYAVDRGAGRLVDVATLTGACIVALGHYCTGLVSNDQAWAERVIAAGAAAGERVWQLPAYQEYKKQYESRVADLKNVGGRAAGTITGGLIIGEFVGDVPWAHLDIAGTAWGVEEIPYLPKGATGVATRTLAQLVMDLASEQG